MRILRYFLLSVSILGLTLSMGSSAQAKWTELNTRNGISFSFAPIVKMVSSSVVNVYAKQPPENTASAPFPDEPFFRQFFGESFLKKLIPRKQFASYLGSGVIIDRTGLIVTNYHVIKDATEVRLILADKRELNAKVILKDEVSDLAFLKISKPGTYPSLDMGDSDALEVGDFVLAIGNPFGVGQTVTSGIVSALARIRASDSEYRFFIQTDAAINPGNSGGALVDVNGKLVGIPTAIYTRSGGSQGIGFAIPSALVKFVASQTEYSSVVHRPWFGADLRSVAFNAEKSFGTERATGAIISHVFEGSPAMRAGLQTGDLILSIDDVAVEDPYSFNYRFSIKPIGSTTKLRVLREGAQMEVRVPLASPPELIPRDVRHIKTYSPFQGATFANLSPAVSDELKLPLTSEGVVVLHLDDASVARKLGFAKGDVILEVNDSAITTTRSLERVILSSNAHWTVSIRRGDRVLKMSLHM